MSQRVINDIKEIVKKTVRAMRVPDIIIGTVSEEDPLEIETSVNQKPYPAKILTVPDHIGELKKDTDVVLVRALGGQRFLVAGTLTGQKAQEEKEEPKEGECPCGCGCKNYSKEDPGEESGGGTGGSGGSGSGGSGDKGKEEEKDDSKEKLNP